jgi:hypothetical protein
LTVTVAFVVIPALMALTSSPWRREDRGGGERPTYPILTVTVAFVVIPALMALRV